MLDSEIATKRLSDWKPETDIRLQKAFGKCVEEVGELLEAGHFFAINDSKEITLEFENEIADVDAVIVMIECAANLPSNNFESALDIPVDVFDGIFGHKMGVISMVMRDAGSSLKIVGRCQIQGLHKFDPETRISNSKILLETLTQLRVSLACAVHVFKLDRDRISARTLAKVESKLPWVMGTATDLLPDD